MSYKTVVSPAHRACEEASAEKSENSCLRDVSLYNQTFAFPGVAGLAQALPA